MSVTLVDFKTKRHEKKAKKLLSECCDMIESLAPLSGYAIVAWDATGRAGVRIEQGGPFHKGAIPDVVKDRLFSAIRENMLLERIADEIGG